jgi:predicted nucleotidyltransferase
MISRDETLNILRRFKDEFSEHYGITALGIFGSVARGQATGTSDVDVVVKMREPNLFTLVHVREELEEELHEHVDIVHYRDRMNAFLKRRIDQEAVYVCCGAGSRSFSLTAEGTGTMFR